MAVPRWVLRAEQFVETMIASLEKDARNGDLSPEVRISAATQMAQRVTTYRGAVMDADDGSGPAGDRGPGEAAERKPKVTRPKGKAKRTGRARTQSPTADAVDPADQ